MCGHGEANWTYALVAFDHRHLVKQLCEPPTACNLSHSAMRQRPSKHALQSGYALTVSTAHLAWVQCSSIELPWLRAMPAL